MEGVVENKKQNTGDMKEEIRKGESVREVSRKGGREGINNNLEITYTSIYPK